MVIIIISNNVKHESYAADKIFKSADIRNHKFGLSNAPFDAIFRFDFKKLKSKIVKFENATRKERTIIAKPDAFKQKSVDDN